MIVGDRSDIQLVEPDDFLRPYVVRPAYHADPNPTDDPWVLHIFVGIGLVAISVAIITLIAHALMPTIHS